MFGRKILGSFSSQAFRVNNINQQNQYTRLKSSSINFSDDTPSEGSPKFLKELLIQDSQTAQLQYTLTQGIPNLLESASKFYEPKIRRSINYTQDILITPGHNSALTCILLALCNINDEVIIFSPSQEFYRDSINFNGAKIVDVSLNPKPSLTKLQIQQRSPDYRFKVEEDQWEIDFKELYEKITTKTKILLINQPHSPTGKIFKAEEFQEISNILKKKESQAFIVQDEQNAEIYFENNQPFRPFEINDLKDRSLLLADIGSMFASPGMGVSITIGNPSLINAIKSINQISYFCLNEVFQKSLSNAFKPEIHKDYFKNKIKLYNEQRKALLNVLSSSNLNLKFWIPNGGIHILTSVNKSSIPNSFQYDSEQKQRFNEIFVKWLEEEKNILACPIYQKQQQSDEELVRWSFTKSLQQIKQASVNLK